MNNIQNPILCGFNPDPSIVRVGDDYYIATSSFEWFPGVRIYHSKDLKNWRILDNALKDIDLRGIPNSGGIWAPSLSYSEATFYLVYTIVKTWRPYMPFKDLDNFLVTTNDLNGDWSEPIYLNSSGFDPSLFHDDDGKKWLVQMEWDYRKDKPRFGGILLQEYSGTEKKLVGKPKKILQKDRLIEGPNLYKHNEYYYLMLAEGGTGWEHSISMARSKTIDGEYQLDPQDYVLTSKFNQELRLQKAGHGELVQLPNDEWILAHLASRPFENERSCVLGRETCLQKVIWNDDGWLRLANGGNEPFEEIDIDLPEFQFEKTPLRDDFETEILDKSWNSLRIPIDESWATLNARKSWLRLRGRDSIKSLFTQSLLAKRLTNLVCIIETKLEFTPENFNQSAGLVIFYNTEMNYFLRISHDEIQGKILGIVLNDDGNYDELIESNISITEWQTIFLRAEIKGLDLQFSASPNGFEWQKIGDVLSMSKLTDDYGKLFHFTGTFAGICCQDLSTKKVFADFDYFEIN